MGAEKKNHLYYGYHKYADVSSQSGRYNYASERYIKIRANAESLLQRWGSRTSQYAFYVARVEYIKKIKAIFASCRTYRFLDVISR